MEISEDILNLLNNKPELMQINSKFAGKYWYENHLDELNNIDEYKNIDFDFVITVCDNAKERCPFFPTKAKKFHYNFPDPAKATGTDEEIAEEFRKVRQQIKAYCKDFITENL